ncbi:MAG: hypothetical protein ACYCVB_14480 [Bacilli bacterium]
MDLVMEQEKIIIDAQKNSTSETGQIQEGGCIMRKTKKWAAGLVSFVILLSVLFLIFWAVQFHNVAVHTQIEVSKKNHLPLTSIAIVGVQLLGSYSYLNLLGIKSRDVTYHISGEYYPVNTVGFVEVTQWPGGKYKYYQISMAVPSNQQW